MASASIYYDWATLRCRVKLKYQESRFLTWALQRTTAISAGSERTMFVPLYSRGALSGRGFLGLIADPFLHNQSPQLLRDKLGYAS